MTTSTGAQSFIAGLGISSWTTDSGVIYDAKTSTVYAGNGSDLAVYKINTKSLVNASFSNVAPIFLGSNGQLMGMGYDSSIAKYTILQLNLKSRTTALVSSFAVPTGFYATGSINSNLTTNEMTVRASDGAFYKVSIATGALAGIPEGDNAAFLNASPNGYVALKYNVNTSKFDTLVQGGVSTEAPASFAGIYSTGALTVDSTMNTAILNSNYSQEILIADMTTGSSHVILNHFGLMALSNIVASPVPEPKTFALLLAGLGVMGVVVRGRKIR